MSPPFTPFEPAEADPARRAEESRARVLTAEALRGAEAALRERVSAAIARLRAGGGLAFLLLALVFGLVGADAGWRSIIVPLVLFSAWSVLVAWARVRPGLRTLVERAAPFGDLLACVLISLRVLPLAPQPRGHAVLMAAVMTIPVAFAGLTVRGPWILATTLAASAGIVFLQQHAGVEPSLTLASLVPCFLLGALAFWAAGKLRQLVDGLVTEQTAKQLVSARGAELEVANARLSSLSDELARERQRLVVALADSEALTRLVAHDMKQPLATIQGLVELVADDLHARLPAEERLEQDLRIAHAQGQRLLGMIHDLLTISRLEKGAVVAKRRREKVGPLLEAVSRAHAPRAGSVRVEVHVDPALRAAVDRELVLRLLDKLVANAFAWVRPGGLVRLSARRDGEWLALRVGNDGPPIPEASRPQLFRKYQTSQSGNSGLGLYLCWLIAQTHSGSIELEEGQELPVSFVARLPADRPEDTPPPMDRVV